MIEPLIRKGTQTGIMYPDGFVIDVLTEKLGRERLERHKLQPSDSGWAGGKLVSRDYEISEIFAEWEEIDE